MAGGWHHLMRPADNEGKLAVNSYSSLPNEMVSAPNGVDYAYRAAGQGGVPLVLLQHFRGNLDS
jgi:hypothetical protein